MIIIYTSSGVLAVAAWSISGARILHLSVWCPCARSQGVIREQRTTTSAREEYSWLDYSAELHDAETAVNAYFVLASTK